MKQYEAYEKSYYPYSAMSVCFTLMNTTQSYVSQLEEIGEKEVAIPILTQLLNHIGTITTRDFQIKPENLLQESNPCINIEPDILIDILWNYGSHFLNILHPHYSQSSLIEQQRLLQKDDVGVIQGLINDIAKKNQLNPLTKEEIYQRVYELQKQYTQKHI